MAAAPPRRSRRSLLQRLVIAGNIVLVLVFLAGAGVLAYGYDKYGQIARVEIGSVLTQSSPEGPDAGIRNFLVVGVDSADGLDPDDPLAQKRRHLAGSLRSDTVMIVRVDPGSNRASLLSLPRDLYVPIPDYGNNRINVAVQLGGPELLIETIQSYLGIPVHHYLQVDFAGFGRLVETIDGVPVYFPYPVRDLGSDLHVPESGCVTLDGPAALSFVRARSYQEHVNGSWRTDGTGDYGRVRRQQQFILQALDRAIERGLRNPVTLDSVIDDVLAAVTVDDLLTGDDLLDLARQFQRFETDSLDLYDLSEATSGALIGGASVVRLQSDRAEPILSVFRSESPGEVQPASVRIRVLNGTGTPGQASEVAELLRAVGFPIAGTSDAERLGVERSEVHFAPGQAAGADLVARWLEADPVLVEDPEVDGVTVVTGADWRGLRAEPRRAEPDDSPPATGSTGSGGGTPSTAPSVTSSTTTSRPTPSTTVRGTIPDAPPPGISCG